MQCAKLPEMEEFIVCELLLAFSWKGRFPHRASQFLSVQKALEKSWKKAIILCVILSSLSVHPVR